MKTGGWSQQLSSLFYPTEEGAAEAPSVPIYCYCTAAAAALLYFVLRLLPVEDGGIEF